MSDDFVRDLEDELVAAARFRAAHPGRVPRRVPVLPRRALLGAVAAALVLLALVAAITLLRGDDAARIASPPPGVSFALPAMQPLMQCDQPAQEALPIEPFRGIGLLERPQRGSDAAPFAPGRLPIGTFDDRATRRPDATRPAAVLHVVPSTRVDTRGGCGADDGPGVCLVADEREFRCFAIDDVSAGRAIARGEDGKLVGVVPDGINRVAVRAGDAFAGADVFENVFQARLPAAAGSTVELAFERASAQDCRRAVIPELAGRVGALREPARSQDQLPPAARDAVGAPAAPAARLWGGDDVEFWVVPAASSTAGCAPATQACVVAVDGESADTICSPGPDPDAVQYRFAPLPRGRSLVFGLVPDGVRAVEVVVGGHSAEVDARDNVFGGILPFPVSDDAAPQLESLP